MKAKEMALIAQGKCIELENLVAVKSINKNPDYYKTLKEFKLWQVITGLINDMGAGEVHINETLQDYFLELSADTKHIVKIDVEEGDNIKDVYDRYEGYGMSRVEISTILTKTLPKKGLMVDFTTGMVVKA